MRFHGLAQAKEKPNVVCMSHPLSRLATRVAYASTQLPRMAWYAGHLYVMRRLAEQVRQQEGGERARRSRDPIHASSSA